MSTAVVIAILIVVFIIMAGKLILRECAQIRAVKRLESNRRTRESKSYETRE